MWQSILKVDAINSARLGLEEAYKSHQFITRLVEGTTDIKVSPREFAFRIRPLETGEFEFWIQSLQRLRFKVRSTELIPFFQDWEAFPAYGPVPGLYRFLTELNSCQSNNGGAKHISRSNAESEAWLRKRLIEHGAEVSVFSETESFPRFINHQDGHRMTINVFRAKGELEVKDSKAILPALVVGIGRAKFLGLGMVVLS